MKKLLVSVVLLAHLLASGEILYQNDFSGENALDGWRKNRAAQLTGSELQFSLAEKTAGLPSVKRTFDAKLLSGRLLAVSAEIKGEKLERHLRRSFTGIQIQFEGDSGKGRSYFGMTINREGSFGWTTFRRVCHAPADLKNAVLAIGMQGATGSFQLRNLKIESLGVPLPLTEKANMGYSDTVAGDGKGGWSDQGAENDGSLFLPELYRKEIAGVPFLLNRQGNSVLSFSSTHFPQGLQTAEFSVGEAAGKASWLYLLHTLCWGGSKEEEAGRIEIHGESGTKTFSVINRRDVQDWWRSEALPNALPGLSVKGKNGMRTLFVSRFKLDAGLGKISSVSFRSAGREPVWIICGATLSSREIPVSPAGPALEIKAGKEWLPFPRSGYGLRLPGSALDLSGHEKWKTSGADGRIRVSERGTLCFERQPEEDLRMLAAPVPTHFSRPREAEMFLDECVRNGIRCIRFHFLDTMLMSGSSQDGVFNTKTRAVFEAIVAGAKKRGMYLMLDIMTHPNGYYAQKTFDPWGNLRDSHNMKLRMHFDPDARKNWETGARQLLLRENPLTKTRLVDDPVLAMVVTFNEQSFAFSQFMDKKLMAPHYRNYLKRRYQTIDAYNAEHRSNYPSFDRIPCFDSRSKADADGLAFIEETERNTLAWYRSTLRGMGYPGIIMDCNLTKNHSANLRRLDNEAVAINSYHDHPSRWAGRGSTIRQQSAIYALAGMFRDLINARLSGKPLVVTEYNHVFWNRYRHQQAYTVGAYAALNDLSILTMHSGVPDIKALVPGDSELAIRPFGNSRDPIAVASEFLTYFLFIRKDAATAAHAVRIRVGEKDSHGKNGLQTLSSPQNLLSLLLRFSIDYRNPAPAADDERIFPLRGGLESIETSATSQSRETGEADAGHYVSLLKQEGFLPEKNRTDGVHLFESETGEILLDRRRELIRIDTPRFQGICALRGSSEKLTDFEIQKLDADAGLTIIAVDGNNPIRTARRMVLVFVTNALNSGMQFYDKEMCRLYHIGYYPPLLQSGSFRVAIRNLHAKRLTLYRLDLSGRRIAKLKPDRIAGEKAVFSVDTAKDGAAVFYELIAE